MDIQVAVLCDAANDSNGNLNLLGAFDSIYAGQFPAVHLKCAIVLRVVFSKHEEGAHKVRLNFVDDDGKSIMAPIDLPLDIRLGDDAVFATSNFIINMQQLKFDQAGSYSIDITIDGRPGASIPLAVKPFPQQPGAAPPPD